MLHKQKICDPHSRRSWTSLAKNGGHYQLSSVLPHESTSILPPALHSGFSSTIYSSAVSLIDITLVLQCGLYHMNSRYLFHENMLPQGALCFCLRTINGIRAPKLSFLSSSKKRKIKSTSYRWQQRKPRDSLTLSQVAWLFSAPKQFSVLFWTSIYRTTMEIQILYFTLFELGKIECVKKSIHFETYRISFEITGKTKAG